jgi:hypothetical protein
MADLKDLGFLSLTEMGNDEQLELLRQVRLARRTPIKQVKTITKKIPTASVSVDQAAELLKILGGK